MIEETRTFDWLLLIDVLEHLETPGQLLEKLDANVKEGGLVLISVPTPCYPRVFGEAFHREVGHVVDGYRLAALDRLLPIGKVLPNLLRNDLKRIVIPNGAQRS